MRKAIDYMVRNAPLPKTYQELLNDPVVKTLSIALNRDVNELAYLIMKKQRSVLTELQPTVASKL